MRIWAAIFLITLGLLLTISLFGYIWKSRFAVGRYTYKLGSEPISDQVIQNGMAKALETAGMKTNEWVPVQGWPVLGGISSTGFVAGYVTLSNCSHYRYYLYVAVQHPEASGVIRYDLHRSK